MQKYIKLSEVHAALQNETLSLNTNKGQITVEILDADARRVRSWGMSFLEYDNHKHEIVVKLTNEKGESEKADITVMESHANLSRVRKNLRNAPEIKNLTDSIVQAIDTYVSESYRTGGVKSLLRQSALDHNEK